MTAPEQGGDLARAQGRKIERLLDRTAVGLGTRVLEIGTGWGELAIRAARRGALVHSITLSTEQRDLAREAHRGRRPRRPGHRPAARLPRPAGRHDVRRGAVGGDDRGGRLRLLGRLLRDPRPGDRPGGRVGIQAITMPHDRMLATRRTYTWINKYIFPGGFLPSVEVIDADHLATHAAAGHRPAGLRPALRRDVAAVGRAVPGRARQRADARLRRDVPADVALLPGVLPGRLRRPATSTSTRSC